MTTARQVRQVVGQQVRTLREQAGVRQEDLAKEARNLGLAWNGSRVAALERGEKPINVEDLALLVGALTNALGRPVHVAELFDVDDWVSLSRTAQIPARRVAEVLGGTWSAPAVLLRDGPQDQPIKFSDAAYQRHLTVTQLRSSNPTVGDLEDIHRAMGEGDERARRALNEELAVYLTACHALWGRSLTAERDARLSAAPEASPASLAARRGRITRELLAELRELQSSLNAAMGNSDLGEHPATT